MPPITIPASGANQWVQCPLWVTMNAKHRGYERDDKRMSRLEGIAAHIVVEDALNGIQHTEGELLPDGNTVTDEMVDFASTVLTTVDRKGLEFIEESFSVPSIHPMIKGRLDHAAYIPKTNTLKVTDFKYGHTLVDEFKNYQLVLGAEGLIDKYDLNTLGLQLEFTIIQTRCYGAKPVRTWSTNYEATRFMVANMRDMAKLTQEETPKAAPGSVCSKCPGRHACTANRKQVWGVGMYGFEEEPPQILDSIEASTELRYLEESLMFIKGRVDALTAQVEFNIKRGEPTPHHILKRSSGDLKWTIPIEKIQTLGALNGVELTRRVAITPTQAKKLLDEDTVLTYSERSAGREKLVPYNASDVDKLFNKDE